MKTLIALTFSAFMVMAQPPVGVAGGSAVAVEITPSTVSAPVKVDQSSDVVQIQAVPIDAGAKAKSASKLWRIVSVVVSVGVAVAAIFVAR